MSCSSKRAVVLLLTKLVLQPLGAEQAAPAPAL
eukprot:SAG11_NODE_22153_length_411_cov_0.794872_1_plen_32_part_01